MSKLDMAERFGEILGMIRSNCNELTSNSELSEDYIKEILNQSNNLIFEANNLVLDIGETPLSFLLQVAAIQLNTATLSRIFYHKVLK